MRHELINGLIYQELYKNETVKIERCFGLSKRVGAEHSTLQLIVNQISCHMTNSLNLFTH